MRNTEAVLLSTIVVLASVLGLPQTGRHLPASGALHNATGELAVGRNSSRNVTSVRLNRGVCTVEVPTASIAKDPNNVPRGNGSRPELSKVRRCCEGYKRNAHYFYGCDPVCNKPCVNANCTAPDTCTCHPGYTNNLADICVEICPRSCQNGRCSGEECVCDPGHTLDATRQFCVPLCRDNCGGHGNCTAPDVCDCPEQFPLSSRGVCEARCPNCDHGDCLGPGQCVCHKGYEKSQQDVCVPVCSRGCQNGICVAPEVCACQYGFSYDEALGLCQPRCTSPCYNSLCTGPETCSCKPGYVRDETNPVGNVCKPHCPDGCPNGVCSNPNFCVCNFGYVKDKSVKNSQKCVKRP